MKALSWRCGRTPPATADGSGILAQLYGEDGAELGTPIGDQRHYRRRPAGAGRSAATTAATSRSPGKARTPTASASSPAASRRTAAPTPPRWRSTPPPPASSRRLRSRPPKTAISWWSGKARTPAAWASTAGSSTTTPPPLTGEFLINTSYQPATSRTRRCGPIDETGGYLVVWEGLDASGSGIFLRRLTAAGGFVAGEQAVNNVTAGAQRNPAVAASGLDSPGDANIFVVVWQSPDSAANGIWARVYSDAGSPLGLQQLVSVDDGRDQTNAFGGARQRRRPRRHRLRGQLHRGGDPRRRAPGRRAADRRRADLHPRPPPGRHPAHLRRLRSAGQTDEFAISVAGDITGVSSVAAEDDGDFVVVWRSDGQDGSGARGLRPPLRRPADLRRRLRKRRHQRVEPDRALISWPGCLLAGKNCAIWQAFYALMSRGAPMGERSELL